MAPDRALAAHFQALRLSINISEMKTQDVPREGRERTSEKKTGKGSKKRKRPVVASVKEADQSIEEDEIFSSLDLDDQLAIESFMSSLNFPPPTEEGGGSRCERQSKRRSATEILENVDSSKIIDALLEQLLLKPRKSYRGLRVIVDPSSCCLTQLAPAVFHVPYLKVASKVSFA